MRQGYVPVSKVEDVLRSLDERQRLVALVTKMAQEIERLSEDNAQLRAAVTMYRDAVRRGNRHALGR